MGCYYLPNANGIGTTKVDFGNPNSIANAANLLASYKEAGSKVDINQIPSSVTKKIMDYDNSASYSILCSKRGII